MKKLLLVVAVLLVGCGSDKAPNSQACWADQDCPSFNKCIEGICIEKPECAKDEDCGDATLACSEGYKCVPVLSLDTCIGQPCGPGTDPSCVACGSMSTCNNIVNITMSGICEDICTSWKNFMDQIKTSACVDKTNSCLNCYCWNNFRQGEGGTGPECSNKNTWSQNCCATYEIKCASTTRSYLEAKKLSLEQKNLEQEIQNTRNICN